MDAVMQYYQQMYYNSPGGSAREAAAFDVLCVCDGKLSLEQLQEHLTESECLVLSTFTGPMEAGCSTVLLGEYHRQKVALYQQFLAMVGSPLA